jgi:hypothetical protein
MSNRIAELEAELQDVLDGVPTRWGPAARPEQVEAELAALRVEEPAPAPEPVKEEEVPEVPEQEELPADEG